MSSSDRSPPNIEQSTSRRSTRTTRGKPPVRFADYSGATRKLPPPTIMSEAEDLNSTIVDAPQNADREDVLLAAIHALTAKVSTLQATQSALEETVNELRLQHAARSNIDGDLPESASVPPHPPGLSTLGTVSSMQRTHSSTDVSSDQRGSSFANATTFVSSANLPPTHTDALPAPSRVEFPPVHRRLHTYVPHHADLPAFSGAPEDWPSFKSAFHMSTDYYGFGDIDNNFRLKKCLQGDAKLAVRSLLIHPNNTAAAMAALEMRFGRPEQLVRSQLQVVNNLPLITEQSMHLLVAFATDVQSVVAFLDQPETSQHLANPLLMDELLSKLPCSRRVDWARHAAGIKPYATLRDLGSWLEELSQYVCVSVFPATKEISGKVLCKSNARGKPDPQPRVMLTSNQPEEEHCCSVCNKNTHAVPDCQQFKRMPIDQRWKVVSDQRLCIRCLKPGHLAWRCKNRQSCAVDNCARPHHKLLHSTPAGTSGSQRAGNPFGSSASRPPSNNNDMQTTNTAQTANNTANSSRSQSANNQQPSTSSESRETSSWSGLMTSRSPELMYRIVPVNLYNGSHVVSTFALFDEGSYTSMIDLDLARQLQLDGKPSSLNLQWINDQNVKQDCMEVNLKISGVGLTDRKFELEQVKTIRGLKLPVQSADYDSLCEDFPAFADLPLTNYSHARPQLLLGLRHCHLGLALRTVLSNECGPVATLTHLGWIVYGPRAVDVGGRTDGNAVLFCNDCADSAVMNDLDSQVRDYFSLDNFGVRCPVQPLESDSDIRARHILSSTTRRIGDRFETGLLWRSDEVVLPDSRSMALRRLATVESKMSKDAEYYRAYEDNLMAYVAKGYARRLNDEEARITTPRTWYLPHFGVVNPHKPGKLRIVFDAAAAVNGVSLNSVLLKGPDLNRPMTEVLHQFRVGIVGVCGDIREMFNQILIRPSDRQAQRFLWRHGDPRMPVETYEMTSVTFGAACSPCSAQYIKNMNADEYAHIDGDAVQAIKQNHYVDDYVASFKSIADANRVTNAVIEIHRHGGFELRGIVSNSNEVLRATGYGNQSTADGVDMQLENDASEKVLGLYWETTSDTFRFNFRFHRVHPDVLRGVRRPTKREILSIAMSVFDPFGMLANYTIYVKVLLQDVWRLSTGWDEAISDGIDAKWTEWFAELPRCGLVRVPRCYTPHLLTSGEVQLHAFADASSVAYAAVAFWRVQSSATNYELAFVAGKSRCAPMKLMSIPRLELQAAVLATRLVKSIMACHDLNVSKIWLWTDSKTVVQWIRSDSRRYKAFVGHRIAEILEESDVRSWRWVPTADNVADDATRTKYPPKYNPEGRWLRGPAFLRLAEEQWPREASVSEAAEDDSELKAEFVNVVRLNDEEPTIEFERFSNFHLLRRNMAWVYRFIGNARCKAELRKKGELDAMEIEMAERRLSRLAQREGFAPEYKALSEGKNVDRSSSVFKMLPFLDEDGVMRVRGRTDAAAFMTEFAKNPVVLPRQHRLSRLIVVWEHERKRHQQQEAVVSAVLQRYRIAHLRQLVRNVKVHCQICRYRSAKPAEPIMGQLPEDRLTPYVRPFTYTGLDYFGPVYVAVGRRREKRWVALFTCLTVRAVHLEVAADLSTDACLMCIRNFVNTRGVPIRIRSDNGKNFVGAANILKNCSDFLDHAEMRRALGVDKIEWVFNAPGNPEAGGCWERMVQSVKKILAISLHEVAPKVETLRSLLIEAANIINSRPLTYIPLESEDAEPLTPNHLLLGCSNSTQTTGPTDDRPICHRKQLNVLQQLKDRFWKRWIQEYLPVLTKRAKGFAETAPLKPGDLVLVCEDGQARAQWRRGRIREVFPGTDGRVRVATVQTKDGVLRRAASKLAVLNVKE